MEAMRAELHLGAGEVRRPRRGQGRSSRGTQDDGLFRGRAEGSRSAPVARIADRDAGLTMMTSTKAWLGGRKTVRSLCARLRESLQPESPRARALSKTMNRTDCRACRAFI